MRKHHIPISWPRRNPRHSRFPIPNTVWEHRLKPIAFVILSYLCCQHSHGGASLSPEMVAKGVHKSEGTARKYWEETSTVPFAPTKESVQAVLAQLKQLYPTGAMYPTPYRSTSGDPYSRGTHCSGWATLCSDAAFGNLPWRRVDNPSWNQIRPGDLIRYDNSASGHVVVVISKTDEYVKVTESGLNNKVRWGGQYFKWWLEEQSGYTLYTRYPE